MHSVVANTCSSRRKLFFQAGFSLTEMVITITTIGIMAGIVLSSMGNMTGLAKEQLAKDKLKMLNDAVHKYAMSSRGASLDIVSRIRSNGFDERHVSRQLKFRSPTDPSPGSPYLMVTYQPAISSSQRDYRMEWTGTVFKLIPPGQPGTGLKVAFDGSDIGAAEVFPPNYTFGGR
jgi:prepilin-type N-terminal cleavage/methylation domain-containing protein